MCNENIYNEIDQEMTNNINKDLNNDNSDGEVD